MIAPDTSLPLPHTADGDESGDENNASLVLLVRTHGLRLLLTGDVEPPAQAVLERLLAGVEVDVLKVPHHGSRYQDLDWLRALRAQVALVPVGAGNDYGHPATATVQGLAESGTKVYRTDRDGSVAVVESGGEAAVVTR